MSYKCGIHFLILKTNYFWSNRGIVCLIISVQGPTQTPTFYTKQKSVWIGLNSFCGDFKNSVKKKIEPLGKNL